MNFLRLIFCIFLCFVSLHSVADTEQKQCIDCHQSQVSNWQQSDHAKAMATANEDSVLGNFNNAEVTHYTQKALFYTDNKQFKVDLTEGDKTTSYNIIYTFGHYPLQQYLVPAEGNRYQVLPFSWDSRSKEQGGQRWYPNYQFEDVKPNDRLHWQQALQNWNGMCADCHSDGLKRNFDVTDNTFSTTWDNINIGCQSCHGKMSEYTGKLHIKSNALIDNPNDKQAVLNWLLTPGESVARLKSNNGQPATQQEKQQRGEFMDTCFSCHSLRSPLTDGFTPNNHFLDQFSPTLLTQPLYHADGQIKEEVYVYGSFLQSKMYAEGVTCIDCHDAHSMKIKVQGNGLCLQCHNAETYQQPKHINHPLNSKAAECVSCHMPETTYMGADDRRDHSFKIPRPHLSDQYDTPNACTSCHEDKSNQWAAKQVKTWFGETSKLAANEARFLNLMHAQQLPLDQHLAIINDDKLNEIKRASAILMLPNSTQVLTDFVIKPWTSSNLPLIRLATARVGHMLSDDDLQKSYRLLLTDKFKAIRTAAARELIGVNVKQTDTLKKAFEELTVANQASMWRGEGNLNQSLIHLTLEQHNKAIVSLQNSIKVDPYFEPSYVNLAELYRTTAQANLEKAIYKKALATLPKSASLHYAYGMYLIRSGNKQDAVAIFKKAVRFEPTNPQYAYLYFLALDATGKTAQALKELTRQINAYQTIELVQLGLSFSQKLSDRKSYEFFYKKYTQLTKP